MRNNTRNNYRFLRAPSAQPKLLRKADNSALSLHQGTPARQVKVGRASEGGVAESGPRPLPWSTHAVIATPNRLRENWGDKLGGRCRFGCCSCRYVRSSFFLAVFMGSWQSLRSSSPSPKRPAENGDDFLDSKDREEDIAKFPYVEFTGRDGITCPTCQGIGYIPPEQVNELVALIPYHDQRLKPRRTKFYVLVSVLLCLLASGLVVFFLFPHSVHVEDNGIQAVRVWFDQKNSLVILSLTANLRIRNSNFYSVAVTSLTTQVQYMNSVVGTHQMNNVTRIQPLSNKLVNFTVKSKMGVPSYYAYFFCTLSRIRVHNVVIFMRTSVKISYLGYVTQSSLETHHYVDCGANSTIASGPEPTPPTPEDVVQSLRKLAVLQ
uniref:transmembrane protein 106C n=1 Tax=Euleptes europaea TaxID=460621 RepID=UPI00254174D8|nr:transmembrane protein 106C [Euleptes europaea]